MKSPFLEDRIKITASIERRAVVVRIVAGDDIITSPQGARALAERLTKAADAAENGGAK